MEFAYVYNYTNSECVDDLMNMGHISFTFFFTVSWSENCSILYDYILRPQPLLGEYGTLLPL